MFLRNLTRRHFSTTKTDLMSGKLKPKKAISLLKSTDSNDSIKENKMPKAAPSKLGNGGAKSIEEIYQKKSQLEHILLRPDTYIGSVEAINMPMWVYENDKLVHRPVTFVPGLYKIFDEIMVNGELVVVRMGTPGETSDFRKGFKK